MTAPSWPGSNPSHPWMVVPWQTPDAGLPAASVPAGAAGVSAAGVPAAGVSAAGVPAVAVIGRRRSRGQRLGHPGPGCRRLDRPRRRPAATATLEAPPSGPIPIPVLVGVVLAVCVAFTIFAGVSSPIITLARQATMLF